MFLSCANGGAFSNVWQKIDKKNVQIFVVSVHFFVIFIDGVF